MPDDPALSADATNPSIGRTIRVALRIADGRVSAYVREAIVRLAAVRGVEIVLLLAIPASRSVPPSGRLLAPLERIYGWMEYRALRGSRPALAPVPLIGSLAEVQRIAGASRDAQAAALSEARADLLVDLVGDEAPEALPLPAAGRWRLRYAIGERGPRLGRLRRPAAAHVLVESVLAIDLASGATLEACRSIGAMHRIGYARSRDAVYWRSASFIARRLADLAAGRPIEGWTEVASSGVSGGLDSSVASSASIPPFVELATTLIRRSLARLLFATDWVVLVRRRNAIAEPPTDLRGFRPIEPPLGRFYADPFVLVEGEETRLYVEDCPIGSHRGRITSLVEASGRWRFERIVLDDIIHRAYPHVVRTSSGWVMTPDGGRSGGVDVFTRARPTDPWVFSGRILDEIAASDPTLLVHDGRFWLFMAVTGPGMDPWDELHLYSAAELSGPWEPHPRNPVVADVRRARPAGRVLSFGATMVRPGQDCSLSYGRRIVLNAIRTLTTTDYDEQPIAVIEPNGMQSISRTHTYSFDGNVEALDGYRRRARFAGPWRTNLE